MRKRIKICLLATLTLMSFACTSEDDSVNNSNELNAEIDQIENEAMNGSWIIASYIDSGIDETNDFAGYSFTFNENGTLIASNGGSVVEGTWSVTADDSSSDDSRDESGDDIDFNIFFSSPEDFNELTDDWEIISISSDRIELRDVSGGNGGIDTLVFQRN